MKKRSSTKRKSDSKKLMLYGLGAGAVAGAGYLALQYYKKRNAYPATLTLPSPVEVKKVISQNKESFPLGVGAKGNLVKMLQTALLSLGGASANAIRATSIKPNGEADGVFGNGTVQALFAAGYPASVSEALFTQIISKNTGGSSVFNAQSLAASIKSAAESSDILSVTNSLSKIPNVSSYQAVSGYFKDVRVKGVRVTSLVNALLSVAFANNEAAKVKIRSEFQRMGLVNRGGVWSLSGFNNNNRGYSKVFQLAVTKKPTLLKEGQGDFITPEVARKKVLGYVTGGKAGVVQVCTAEGQIVYAPESNLDFI